MDILYAFMVVIEVLVSFLLIGIILLQKSKGGGFAGIGMASAVGENLFGSRAGNILTKATVVLASVFLINTLGMAKIQASSSGQERSILDSHIGVIREIPPEPAPELRELDDVEEPAEIRSEAPEESTDLPEPAASEPDTSEQP